MVSKQDSLKSKIDHFEIISKQLLEYGSEEADNLDTNMFHSIRRLLLVDRWDEAVEGTLLTHLPPEIQSIFISGILSNFQAHVQTGGTRINFTLMLFNEISKIDPDNLKLENPKLYFEAYHSSPNVSITK